MTNTEFNQIQETLKASKTTLETLKTLEDNGGAQTSKDEMIETIIKQLKQI